MKVTLINYSSAGLFHYSTALVNALAQNDRITAVQYITSHHNNLALITRSPKISVVAQPVPQVLGPYLRWCFNLSQRRLFQQSLRNFQPDLIHICDSYPHYFLHHYLLRQYPVIFTQHDPLTHSGDPWPHLMYLNHLYLQWLSRRVIVHGTFLKQELRRHFPIPDQKVIIMRHGNLSLLVPDQPSRPLPHRPLSVLFFGRIVSYKGLSVLLQALLILQQRAPPCHLVIAGRGSLKPYRPWLRQLRHVQLQNHFIPDEEIATYFKTSDVLVLPYFEATQSGVAILGLSVGLPIVASAVGSLPEILRHEYNSLLVSPNNPLALATALARLRQDAGLRQRLGQAALTTATRDLSWTSISQDHVDTYTSLLC